MVLAFPCAAKAGDTVKVNAGKVNIGFQHNGAVLAPAVQAAVLGQLDQVIRAWKAPKDGKIAFTSQLQRRPVNPNGVGQDGCEVYVAKTDDDYLFSQVYDALDLELHEIGGETDMKAGEMIYFVLSCSGNYTFDQTYWEITIEYLP